MYTNKKQAKMGWYFIRLKTSSNGKAPEGVYFMLFISIKEAF
jgi:hypothetical protein